ncbi:MAG: DUF4129 domain-containing protein [Planctomycetes bacterium]|nr:DUF4129 domain-containing protein [Planctomycetota bacterium]
MAMLRGLVLVALVLGGLAAQDDYAARAERVLAQHGCQDSLPGESAPARRGSGRPDGSEPRGERSGAPGRSGGRWNPGLPIPPIVAQILLWTIVALAIALLVASIVRGLGGSATAARAPSPTKPAARPAAVAGNPPEPDAALPDHARLAAAGDFAGAVRAVLQAAFAAWVQRGGPLPRAATAREVLRLVRNRRLADAPLAQLVAAVERAHFGGRGADRGLYEASRDWLGSWEASCRSAK